MYLDFKIIFANLKICSNLAVQFLFLSRLFFEAYRSCRVRNLRLFLTLFCDLNFSISHWVDLQIVKCGLGIVLSVGEFFLGCSLHYYILVFYFYFVSYLSFFFLVLMKLLLKMRFSLYLHTPLLVSYY